ncbi:MAG: rRNA maturation RNase YbeY [Candidatus Omnitrophica bacterium]|nr:rRNA maturation RNase YbeY [Candidatus Omnitrophota bacterium]
MKIQIDIRNLQKQIPLKTDQVISRAKEILRHEAVTNAELSVVFVNDQRIKALNKKYLNVHRATDVLAFDFLSLVKQQDILKPKAINGEIIISTGAVCRQAKIFQNSRERELTLYLIHGILHLLGFDDHRSKDIKRMRDKEGELLSFLKIKAEKGSRKIRNSKL